MSKIADKVEEHIKKAFPLLKYKKELYVSYKGQQLFFDFVLTDLNIFIEVQGRQHYAYVPFFHKIGSGFRGQRYRDSLKNQWCSENGKILLALSYKEIDNLTDESFRNRILLAVKGGL
jgi:very-short-patch-repair endonuclease